MQPSRWLSRFCILLAIPVVALTMGGCPPPSIPEGNDNVISNENLNDNDPGQEIPREVTVLTEGDGEVDQETLAESQIRLTATPAEGWEFAGWSGLIESDENPLTVDAVDGATITARFVERAMDDADGDGIANADDRCPQTPAGASVDTAGCALSELDDDDDGVTNDRDQCANTPAADEVDEQGCSIVMDGDNDGVTDEVDLCPQTPAGADVDDDGCAASEVDTDGDGVPDAIDECPNTPPGDPVDAIGCTSVIGGGCAGATGSCFSAKPTPGCDDMICCEMVCAGQIECCSVAWNDACVNSALTLCNDDGPPGGGGGGGPVCGNGAVEPGEDCEPDGGVLCNSSCRFICGNGIIQGVEQCEPPNTPTCDAQCRVVSGGVEVPLGDWLSTQFILNGASGVLAFNAPETYRLNVDGAMTMAFFTVDETALETEVQADVTVLNTVVTPGVMTDVYSIAFGADESLVFRTKIDAFDLNINTDGTTTWSYDYTTEVVVDLGLVGGFDATTRLIGTQTGTIGGDPAQIVWDTLTGTAEFCLDGLTCEDCEFDGVPCNANGCCVYTLDESLITLPTSWTKSGG